MQRRHVTIALLILSLPSCGIYFEQDFYERISGMKFPKEIQVIETFDNGEFFTTTSFWVDSPHLKDFMTKYGFDRRDKIYPSQFLGNNVLKKAQPDFTNLQDILRPVQKEKTLGFT